MKKVFEQPILKVVRMQNNIIATSLGSTNDKQGQNPNGYTGGFAPDRDAWDEEEW